MTREHEPPYADLTPHAGSATDVAPLGRSKSKPPHEQTADEDRDVVDWQRFAATAEFKSLLRAKARFIVPATVFFIVYYFALPILVGYAPELMAAKGHRPGQHRLPVRALAVLHGVDHRLALTSAPPAASTRWRATSSTEGGQERSMTSARDVPGLHRDHAVASPTGRRADPRARAPTSRPDAASPAGRTASRWRATT